MVFTRWDVVEPDLLYVSNVRASELLNEKHALGAELVIEIASPGTRRRDTTIKRQLYERTGVTEYWFVDPDRHQVSVYRRVGEQFTAAHALTSTGNHTLTTELLPGFALLLTRLFRE